MWVDGRCMHKLKKDKTKRLPLQIIIYSNLQLNLDFKKNAFIDYGSSFFQWIRAM